MTFLPLILAPSRSGTRGRIFALVAPAVLAAVAFPPARAATPLPTSAGELRVEEVVTGLDEPWAIGFLPEGGLLMTERDGRLLHWSDGRLAEVSGVPTVAAAGQGGLLDVLIPRDFAQTREVFFSYSKPQPRGAGTAIFRATLSPDAARLEDVRTIFELTEGSSGGIHFGSRIVEEKSYRDYRR